MFHPGGELSALRRLRISNPVSGPARKEVLVLAIAFRLHTALGIIMQSDGELTQPKKETARSFAYKRWRESRRVDETVH